MVMVSGAIGLYRKGGRSPPPKRGRPGGGRCAAAPYKHRLAHAPGRQSRSGRAFRCVGVLGQRPKRILPTFVRTKVGPRRVGVLTMISKRPAPPIGARNLFHAPPSGDSSPSPDSPTTAQRLPQPSGQGSLSSYSLIYASFCSPFSRLISSSSSTR